MHPFRSAAFSTALALSVALAPSAAFAQTQGEPDVTLDIPNLQVEQLTLEVDKLQANISLDARLAQLLTLTAGVDLRTDRIKLDIKGVKAQAKLTVYLDDVYRILDRTLTTIDRNPQILEGLLNAVSGLLSQTVNTLGQTVVRTVDATGNILERTLDSATGAVIGQSVVGSVLDLPVVSESINAAGQTVRQVRDASGAVIELVLDASGSVLSTRVVSQAMGGTGTP